MTLSIKDNGLSSPEELVDEAMEAGLDGSRQLTVHTKMLRPRLRQTNPYLGGRGLLVTSPIGFGCGWDRPDAASLPPTLLPQRLVHLRRFRGVLPLLLRFRSRVPGLGVSQRVVRNLFIPPPEPNVGRVSPTRHDEPH